MGELELRISRSPLQSADELIGKETWGKLLKKCALPESTYVTLVVLDYGLMKQGGTSNS